MVNLKKKTTLRAVIAGFLTAASVIGLGACATGDPGVVYVLGNAIPKNQGGVCVSDEIKNFTITACSIWRLPIITSTTRRSKT